MRCSRIESNLLNTFLTFAVMSFGLRLLRYSFRNYRDRQTRSRVKFRGVSGEIFGCPGRFSPWRTEPFPDSLGRSPNYINRSQRLCFYSGNERRR
jgi:hypothetical protein